MSCGSSFGASVNVQSDNHQNLLEVTCSRNVSCDLSIRHTYPKGHQAYEHAPILPVFVFFFALSQFH